MRNTILNLTLLSLALGTIPAHASLIGLYKFEGNANDTSGNGNHGTLSANPPTLTAPGGGYTANDPNSRAYQFGAGSNALDPNNQFVTLPININPSVMPQVTFGAWVQYEATDAQVIRGIISHDNGNYDRTLDIDTRGGGGEKWCLFVGPTGTGVYCQSSTSNNWTFVAARYDAATNTAQLTINGTHSAVLTANPGQGLANLTVGRNPNFDLPFRGLIDDVFVFDSYLTNDQLDRIARGGIADVPEPASLAIIGSGLLSIAFLRRNRRS
jgi:hypothetical protein